MLKIVAALGNVGGIFFLAYIIFEEWSRLNNDQMFWFALILLVPVLNLLALWEYYSSLKHRYKQSLLGLWVEVRKKKLRKELTEQD